MKALDLRPDGTIVIRDGQREWVLRRPTIGEWGDLVEMIEGVDERIRTAGLDENGQPMADQRAALRAQTAVIRGTRGENASPPAYAECIAKIIETLNGGEVNLADLPVWCTTADAVSSIIGHWREVPLDLSPAPAG